MPPRRRAEPRSPDYAALGRAVEELRREAGLTQEELAERMGVEFPPAGYLDRRRTNPTFSWLLRLARELDIELSDLVERFERIRREGSVS